MALDRLAIVHRRMHQQRLAGEPFDTPAQVVGWLGAMQAQEYAEAKWSIAERARDCTDVDVEEAFARGEILRTHVLRPTWHFVTPADIRWLLELTAPRVHAASRYWCKQSGLDRAVLQRSHEVVREALQPGEPLLRKELAEALTLAGVEEAKGIRLGYIVMHAELEGLICSGPRRGKQHTYVLLDERVREAEGLTREQALAALTLRYFLSHGPATVKDFSWWSGLTVADAKAGLEAVGDDLESEQDDEGTSWFSSLQGGIDSRAPGAFLIPTYDELGVAYKGLRMVLAEQPPRDGLLQRPIVIDGMAVGSWKRTVTKRSATIHATLFKSPDNAQAAALDAVVERFGMFTGSPASLELTIA
ncbi:MAG: winged helix DNA-binding domain-containing protein [Actinomycetota bacterium]|nr:winged helix DNA-binding domain-containing protein [Actinomycetota bacterium]